MSGAWKPSRRDWLGWRIATWGLLLASKGYRDRIEGTIRLGMLAAASPVTAEANNERTAEDG